MEAYRVTRPIKDISKEELQQWLKNPITKALMEEINKFNKEQDNSSSIMVAVQYDNNIPNALLHLAIMPH